MFFSITGKIHDIRKVTLNQKDYAEIIVKKKFFNKEVFYCFFVTYYPLILKIGNCEIEIGDKVQIKFSINSRIKNDKYFTNLFVEKVDMITKKGNKNIEQDNDEE